MVHYEIEDGSCVLRLDVPPLNTITFELLDELQASIRRANQDDDVQRIVLIGRSDHFSAGADVRLFKTIETADDAVRTSGRFQRAFQTVEDSKKPIVAALAGRVMGGAVELAAACHQRIAADGARFQMPEVNLGINPGSGGTQRLPRLIGVAHSLDLLLSARPIDAETALELGLIDDICPAEELLNKAVCIAQNTQSPVKTSERTDRIDDPEAIQTAFEEAEKRLARIPTEIIAARKIIELVRIGVDESIASGMIHEQQAFAECIETPAARNRVSLFFATRETGKLDELKGVEPRNIATVGVIGMGTMGTGIVQAILIARLPVIVLEENESSLDTGRQRIAQSLSKRVEQGKMSQKQADSQLASIHATTEWSDLADADFVIESVFEDPTVKQSVLQQAEAVCRPDAILATNTSTLSLDKLSDRLQRPKRLIGLHFFNPAHRMPLVEVIRRESTPLEVLTTAVRLAKTLRKTPVVVHNREGFLVNRIFIPYMQEALFLLEEGAAPTEIDAAMLDFSFPMGPITLIDMAGIDILVHAQAVLDRAFDWHGPISPIAQRLVERGHVGQKSRAGVYRYEPPDRTPLASDTTSQIIADVQHETGRSARSIGADEITERLVLRMVSEAFWVLEERIVRCASDIDVSLVLGTGFPDFRGGPISYANHLGLKHVCHRLEDLTARHGQRFRPCRRLLEFSL